MKRAVIFIGMVFILNATNLSKLEKSCEKNDNGKSCLNVAKAYFLGDGVKQNYSETIKYLQKGCQLNNKISCNNLGVLYEKGKGVKKRLFKS